ncbi:DUF3883 domain-containing protein [Bacillus pumilus]|uniref:DUF3883 domain-containing protein n=1 Tax=Bacillus pumilus TaxID=1408 RepID=UPI0011A8FFAC|nr:DUF3883 domain-containing protein [Bacillus pumilus]
MKSDGFTTIFVFYRANSEILHQEINSIKADYFLFLRNIRNVKISVGNSKIIGEIQKNEDKTLVQFDGENYLWRIFEGEKSQIGFALNMTEEIIPCHKEQAVFHCYLPTYEPSPYLFKINSDFSTDPSRKHITLDSRTENAIKDSAAKVPRYFEKEFTDLINSNWIETKNGRLISPREYIKNATFLEESEWNWIRQNSPLIETLPLVKGEALNALDDYLKELAKESYSIRKWIKMLNYKTFVSVFPETLLVKLYANILKQIRNKVLITVEGIAIDNSWVRNENDLVQIGTASKEILAVFISKLDKYLISGELKWLQETFNISEDDLKSIKSEVSSNVLTSDMNNSSERFNSSPNIDSKNQVISKWRAAEKQCVEFEEMLGNKAKDVSKQNFGYDVLSVSPSGIERYIEVKSVKNRNTKISMTNNEYTAAHIHGDNYYICVVYEEGDKIVFEYVICSGSIE